jgi:hypothetical protein
MARAEPAPNHKREKLRKKTDREAGREAGMEKDARVGLSEPAKILAFC